MVKKTQGMFLGVPRFLWRRYMLPALILPGMMLVEDIIEFVVDPAELDSQFLDYAIIVFSLLSSTGAVIVGLHLFAKYREFAKTVSANGYQNCLRCAGPLNGLPSEHACPTCGVAYQLEFVMASWRKATKIGKPVLIFVKGIKCIVVLGILAVLPLTVWFYGELGERRLYEEKWEQGHALADAGAYAEAEQEFLQALELAERFFGEENQRVADSLFEVGRVRVQQDRDSDALPMFQRALVVAEHVFGPQDSDVAVACYALARIYHRQQDYEAAEPLYQRSLEIFRDRPGTQQRVIRKTIEAYVELLRETGREDEAARLEFTKYYGPEPAGALVLEVPYIRQGKTPLCMSACVAMLLQHYEIEFNASKLPSQIMTNSKHGSDMYPVVQYLKGLGAEPTLFYPPNVETLIWLIRKGVPVLVSQAMSEKEQSTVHAVVVIGAADSGDTLVIHDPSCGKRVSLDVATFDRRWILGGGYCRIALILSTEDADFSEGLNPAYAHIAEQFELGKYYVATGDTTKAIAAMQETVQAAPDFIPGYLYLNSSPQ